MNLTFLDAGQNLLAHNRVVEAPPLVLLPTFVTNIPEAVLYFAGVKLSKSVAETHVDEVGE